MNNSFTIGTDTEVSLVGTCGYVSAVGLIGGTKYKPLLVGSGNLQEDNVLAEFAIDPCEGKAEWGYKISKVLASLNKKVTDLGLSFDVKPSIVYPSDQLNTSQALEFGCEADMCAYTMENNTPPSAELAESGLRTCGGHVHVGFDEIAGADIMAKGDFIRICDLLIGVPSVLMEEDNERRRLYGKAGAFRPKEYGVEYRTPSNFWIVDQEHRDWMYDQIDRAVSMYHDSFRITREVADQIIQAINNNDKAVAKRLVNEYKLEVI